jgi:hypothetical protein
MKTVLYVVGPPGVGKSTALTGLVDRWSVSLVQAPKWTISAPFALVGHYAGHAHDGGDTVPYDGAAACLAYMRDKLLTDDRLQCIVLDGDRFSTANCRLFTDSLAGVRVVCVHLDASGGALATRRAVRGSTQNEAWMLGRGTKASKFADTFPDAVRLQTDNMRPAEVTQVLRGYAG